MLSWKYIKTENILVSLDRDTMHFYQVDTLSYTERKKKMVVELVQTCIAEFKMSGNQEQVPKQR